MKLAVIFLGLALGIVSGGLLMGGSLSEWGASTGCGCKDKKPSLGPVPRAPLEKKDAVLDEADS